MIKLTTIKSFSALCSLLLLSSTHANSITIEGTDSYVPPGQQLVITVAYDFTDFAMLGGAMDLYFSWQNLAFVSYTRADHSTDQAQDAASSIGSLSNSNPGLYQGFGIGTDDMINGMNDSGVVGTFVFEVLQNGGNVTLCSEMVCLGPDFPFNSFISLAGDNVNSQLFPNNYVGYSSAMAMPIPSALWLFLGGVGCLLKLSRRSS